MPWSKEDSSFKKLQNKRITANVKDITNEFGASTLELYLPDIKTGEIPPTPPGTSTEILEYTGAIGQTLVVDTSVVNSLTYFASSSWGNTTVANNGSQSSESARLLNWIPDKYDAFGTLPGAGYGIKLYDKNNVEIPSGDSSNWLFDYQTGILMFNNGTTNAGSVINRGPFRIVGYRYIGPKGVIPGNYGGTGYTSYTKGDILIGAGSTFIKLGVGTDQYILSADSNSASGITWIAQTNSGSSITAANINLIQSSENLNYYLTFSNSTQGSGVALSAGLGLSFNPNTNTLITENIVATLQTGYQPNITSVGILTSGVWSATAITAYYGGTGLSSFFDGDILVGSGGTWLNLGKGNTGQVLTISSISPYVSWQNVQAGTAASSVNIGTDEANAERYVIFGESNGSGIYLSSDNILRYNPSSNILSVGGISITSGTNSASTNSGAVIIRGGLGVTGNAFIGSSVTAPFFYGDLIANTATATTFNGNLVGFANTSYNINLSTTNTDTLNHYLVFSKNSSGAGVALSAAIGLSYNPSTGILIGNIFQGNLTGTASTSNYSHESGYAITSGTATSAISALLTLNNSSSNNNYITFTPSSTTVSGGAQSFSDKVYIIPSVGSLTANILAASGVTIGLENNKISSSNDLILAPSSGNVKIENNLNISGNLTINGTTTSIGSTITTLLDPVFVLGAGIGGTNPTVDDNKDRGIEFRYFSGTAKTGFFGFDENTGYFTFIPDATNNDEVFSGIAGTALFTTVIADLIGIATTANYSNQSGLAISSGIAITSNNLKVENATNNQSHLLIFSPNVTTSGSALSSNSTIVFNPSSGLLNVPAIATTSNQNSASITSGSLVVNGGIGITGNAFIGGTVFIVDNTISTSSSNGAFVVTGGVGIGGTLSVGQRLTVSANTLSTSTTTGAFVVTGGIGIGGTASIGQRLTVSANTNSTSSTTGALVVTGGAGIGSTLNVGQRLTVNAVTNSTSSTTGALVVAGGAGIGSTLNVGQRLTVGSTLSSSSTTTGALVVSGGVGINSNAFIGGTVTAPLFFGDLSGFAVTATILTGTATTSRNLITNLIGNQSADHYLLLSPSSSGSGVAVSSGAGISYNPSSQTLKVGGLGLSSLLLTTDQSSLNLFNSPTTINAFQSGTAISVGAATGLFTVNNASLILNQSTASTNEYSGSLIANGGIGILGNAFIGGTITAQLFSGNVSGTFITASNFYGNLSGYATTSYNINVVNSNSSNIDHFLVFSNTNNGSGVALSSGFGLSYNPSSNTLKIGGLGLSSSSFTSTSSSIHLFDDNVTTINAFKSGTAISFGAATGTLTVNNATLKVNQNTSSSNSHDGALVVVGGVGVGGNLNVSGTASSISGVKIENGIITQGSWAGSTISYTYGGTSQNSYNKGDLLVANTAGQLVKFPVSANEKDLLMSDSASGYGISWKSLLTPIYGAFASTTSQSVSTVGGGTTVISFDTIYSGNGVSIYPIGAGLARTTRIYFSQTGIYNIQFSAQLNLATSNQSYQGDIWFRKNGLDLSTSNTRMNVPGKDLESVMTVNIIESFVNGDYLELAMYGPVDDFGIGAFPAVTSPYTAPAVPSIITTVTPVSYVLPGGGTAISGIAQLNNQTGASQTLQVGTSGDTFQISSSSNVHTFNLPDAGTAILRGVITNTTQTIAGEKTFSNILSITDNTSSTTISSGALKVTGGVGIGGSLNVGDASNIDGVVLQDGTIFGNLSGYATTSYNLSVATTNASSFHPLLFTPSVSSSGSAISANGSLVYVPSIDSLYTSGLFVTSSAIAVSYTQGAAVITGGLAASNISVNNRVTVSGSISSSGTATSRAELFYDGIRNYGLRIFNDVSTTPLIEIGPNVFPNQVYGMRFRFSSTGNSFGIGAPNGNGGDALCLYANNLIKLRCVREANTAVTVSLGPESNTVRTISTLRGVDQSTHSGDLTISPGRLTSGVGTQGSILLSMPTGDSTYIPTVRISEIQNATSLSGINTATSAVFIYGGLAVTGNALIGGTVGIVDTTNSTSKSTGALVVSGGAGIGGSIYAGGNIVIDQNFELRLQSSSFYTGFKAGTIGANLVYELPNSFPASGTANSILTSNDSGILTWSSKSSLFGTGTSAYLPLWTNDGTELTNSIAKQVGTSVEIEGHLKAYTKSFLIPHPLDPENKMLEHGSLEGPEHGIYVRGRANGYDEVEIQLPDYWEKLSENTYTILITSRCPYHLYIKKQNSNSFIVKRTKWFLSSKKYIDFDYIVVGERRDIKINLTTLR